ncbi:MAG: hypothetical protein ACK53I_04555, partial [Phenylobacterium sp.]
GHESGALVKKRFLTVLNGHDFCPADFAARRPLTFLFVDFIYVLSWPEACSPAFGLHAFPKARR